MEIQYSKMEIPVNQKLMTGHSDYHQWAKQETFVFSYLRGISKFVIHIEVQAYRFTKLRWVLWRLKEKYFLNVKSV